MLLPAAWWIIELTLATSFPMQPTAQMLLFRDLHFIRREDDPYHIRLRDFFDTLDTSPILPTYVQTITWDHDERGERQRSERIVRLLGRLTALRSVKMDLPTLLSIWTPSCGLLPSHVQLDTDKAITKALLKNQETTGAFEDVTDLELPPESAAWFISREGTPFPACRRLSVGFKPSHLLDHLLSLATSPAPCLVELRCDTASTSKTEWHPISPFQNIIPHLHPCLNTIFPTLRVLTWSDYYTSPTIPGLVYSPNLEILVFVGDLQRHTYEEDVLDALLPLPLAVADGTLPNLSFLVLPELDFGPALQIWSRDKLATFFKGFKAVGVGVVDKEGVVFASADDKGPAQHAPVEVVELLKTRLRIAS